MFRHQRLWKPPRTAGAFWHLLLACTLTAPAACGGTEGASPRKTPLEWSVADPGAPSDTLDFETSEGTWISVDVSPDGKTLAFDLLGDIYTLPIEGGTALCISSGLPYEIQPRWSPDGKRILFTSDRGGGDNLWTMDADGRNRTAITRESFRLLNNGVWHPGGRYVVARKHFTSTRSLGAGEMWMYRWPDGGAGVRLTEKRNEQQDAGEPEFSADGSYLYWSEDMSPGGHFEYNKDPNGTIYVIRRLELATGEIRDLIRLPGGAVRPQASPDGRQLAFVRRIREKSVLCLYNLDTGEVRHLWNGLSKDQQETWALFGVHPGFDWTPDGRSLVISAQGHLWRVDATTGGTVQIPFRAHVRQTVAAAVRVPVRDGGPDFPVKVIRWPSITPDGRTAVFQALGYLYRRDLDNGGAAGPPRRITTQTEAFEFAPALAPDGRSVVYATWNDRRGGQIKKVGLDGGDERTLVSRPGHYVWAEVSRDGGSLVYQRGGGDRYRGYLWGEEPGIYLMNLASSTPKNANLGAHTDHPPVPDGTAGTLLTREGSHPRFSRDGQRIYLISKEGEKAALISVDLLGSGRRVHAVSEHAADFLLSPDERWLAFEELWQTYLIPFPLWAKAIDIGPNMGSLPVRRLSDDAGTYLSWSADGKTIRWGLGPELYSVELEQVEYLSETSGSRRSSDRGGPPPGSSTQGPTSLAAPEDTTTGSAVPPSVSFLGWNERSGIPETDVYFVGAKVLPMDDDTVIPEGVVHVKGNLIVAVGSRAEVPIPYGARVLDVAGRTLLPGFVDVHAHFGSSSHGVYSQQNWAMLASLAFGVTTLHDPSNDSQMVFGLGELVRSGQVLGPRIYSTGTILYGAEGDFKTVINSYEDAVRAVRRTQAWGAITVKSYNQPRREQRQMVIKAGRELGVMVVPEGGSTLNHAMTMLLDGHTTLEHAVPVAPLYEPELRLLGRFGTAYTPTLIVGYGGLFGENWWYQHADVWKNARLTRFVPRSVIDPRTRRRAMAPEEEYHHLALATTAVEAYRRGGNVEVGAHGQMQGLGFHWEMWMLQQGGLSNHQALRAATYNGARALGLDQLIGSIRPGRLADLILLDGDPLADIHQSENIAYTMVNGRLYDSRTLEEVEPVRRPLPPGPILEAAPIEVTREGCRGE